MGTQVAVFGAYLLGMFKIFLGSKDKTKSMKLYTEEQVIEMIEKSRQTGLTAEYLILTTTPIELPSDEEIEKELFYQKQVFNPYPIEEYAYTAYEKGFMDCAQLMRDKIQGGG